jgi:hypothetical protein|nr:MAG TPA: tail protein [Caudoviricetes sp.]
MRTASTDFIAAATTDYARYYGKFTVGETEYTVPLTDLKVTASENGSSDLTIGNAQSSSITFSIYEDTIDLENREMVLFEGLEVSEGNIEYIQIGIFKITSATAEEGKTSYTGYDRMYSSMEMTYVSKLKYPNKDINIVKEICTQAGITFVESTMDDKTISIATAPKGYTRREMLGYLSARQGKNAVINSQGQLEFRWYKDADYTIRPTKYYENGLKFTTSKAFKVEKIVCEVATDNDSKTLTSGSGTMAINISNPFMTQAVLDAVYKKIGGFTYRPLTVECLGDWRLEVGDIVKVTSNGVEYSAPITSIVYDCDGGLKCSIESCGQSDTNNSINPTGPITSQMQRLTAELITANQVIATKISAEQADIKYATIANLNALSGKFDTLSAKAITTDNIAAVTAKLGYMTAEQADIKYANIELTNIDTANVATLFANVGLIDRATVVEGHITGFLDSVEVNANKITAGTLVADRILLKGSESGLLYALNNLGELTSTTVDSLDGYVLTDRTINADKIVANSITANELDVENIFADNAVISTITSQSAFINAISTNSVVVGIKNTVDNLSVGDRNLLLATKNFGKISTSNGDWLMSTDDDGFTVASRTGNGNWNAIRTITDVDATDNSQSDKQVVITIDAKADDLATTPKNYLIACEVYGSNDGFKTWYRAIYTNCYIDGSGNNLKYLAGTRENNKWCTLSYTMTLDKLTSGSWGTYNEYRYGVAVYTTNNNASHTISVRKFKMSFGNVPSDWSPNPDDISVENIYSANTTTIDGGKITTGSITADKISVDDLSAITATIGSWSITTNKIYAGDAETGTAVMQRPTVNTKWVFAAGGKSHTNYGDCPFRVDKEGNLYSTSGTVGGFTIGADYLRTKADSRGYKFGMSSNAQPTGICSYIGKEGTDYDYVYRLGWDGSLETSKLTAGGAVFGGGRVYFEATEKAYLTKGDSVPIVFSTGGYITGGGQTVAFFLPTRLIIGASKATLSFKSSEGVKVRQGGNYCYGSTAETNVRPTSQSISLSGESGVNVQLVMPNSTNAINNDACGVSLTGTLKLS